MAYRVPLELVTRVNGAYNDGSTTLTNSFRGRLKSGFTLNSLTVVCDRLNPTLCGWLVNLYSKYTPFGIGDLSGNIQYLTCLVSSAVEQRLDKALAGGSIPPQGTKFLLTDNVLSYIIIDYSPVAQLVDASDC